MDEEAATASSMQLLGIGNNGTNTETGESEQKTYVKRFIFRSKKNTTAELLEVTISERLEKNFGSHLTWPCSHLLSWFLFENCQLVRNKNILELGCGTSLTGIVAAKLGGHVTLSDSAKLPHCVEQGLKNAEANGLKGQIKAVGITWGSFSNELIKLKGQVDLVLGADVFYDPSVFEDLIVTISYILENNPQAKFFGSYQERSSDWSIVSLLNKWGLECKQILYNKLANSCEIDLEPILQGHTLRLIEITLKPTSS